VRCIAPLAVLLTAALALGQTTRPTSVPVGAVPDLSARYPAGQSDKACAWQFEEGDLYRLAGFAWDGPDGLRLKTGPADLGIGHCDETGAVWAIIVPRRRGQMVSRQADVTEFLDHIWLRFHPSRLDELFPPASVTGPGQTIRHFRMDRIARHKVRASYHVGPRAMPPPESMLIIDVDTQDNVRRFFAVDSTAETVQYIGVFERQPVPPVRPITTAQAIEVFDKVWRKFDKTYPSFGQRPDVDWTALRERLRPRLDEVTNTIELADVLVELLAPLEDLHIWIHVDDQPIAVFRRPRQRNGSLLAAETYFPDLRTEPGDVRWARTDDGIGYLAIDAWRSRDVAASVDRVLAELDGVTHLLLDVRFNGGGNERLAQQVAGRFAREPVRYASSRYRNGPQHDDLGPPQHRTLAPRDELPTWTGPVRVLIGPRCMSSNEAFVAMMGQLPQATLVGEPTAGSSANPEQFDAGHGIVVSVPRWLALRADGVPLEQEGIVPDERIEIPDEQFTKTRDGLLEEVLRRLRR